MAHGGRNGIDAELGSFLVVLFNRYAVVAEILKRYSEIHPGDIPNVGRWQLDDESEFHMSLCAALEFAPGGDQLGVLIGCAEEVFEIARTTLAKSLDTHAKRLASAIEEFDATFDNSADHNASLVGIESRPSIRRKKMALDARHASLILPKIEPLIDDWRSAFRDHFELMDDYERLELTVLACNGRLQAARDKKDEIRRQRASLRANVVSTVIALIALIASGITLYVTLRGSDTNAQTVPAPQPPTTEQPGVKPAALQDEQPASSPGLPGGRG